MWGAVYVKSNWLSGTIIYTNFVLRTTLKSSVRDSCHVKDNLHQCLMTSCLLEVVAGETSLGHIYDPFLYSLFVTSGHSLQLGRFRFSKESSEFTRDLSIE